MILLLKRAAVSLAAASFAGALVFAMLALPAPAVHLPAAVGAHMATSGVAHPVTAVLLNFRSYDTLLEIGVLLLALLGVLAVTGAPAAPHAAAPAEPVQRMLAGLVAPLMVLVAVYLLWAGAIQPGGAFQAGAVLAAAAVLLHLTGILPGWGAPGLRLRAGLAAGFLIFLVVAGALLARGAMMEYPPAQAGRLILLIEAGLTVSLGLTMAGLFLVLSRGRGDAA